MARNSMVQTRTVSAVNAPSCTRENVCKQADVVMVRVCDAFGVIHGGVPSALHA